MTTGCNDPDCPGQDECPASPDYVRTRRREPIALQQASTFDAPKFFADVGEKVVQLVNAQRAKLELPPLLEGAPFALLVIEVPNDEDVRTALAVLASDCERNAIQSGIVDDLAGEAAWIAIAGGINAALAKDGR